MKKLLLFLLLGFTGSIYGEAKVEIDFSLDSFCYLSPENINIAGLYYRLNEDKPYSGENLCVYLSSGNRHSHGYIKKGLLTGKWTFWSENGRKIFERFHKDDSNIVDGIRYTYYDNGELASETSWTDFMIRNIPHGKFTYWHMNGQKKMERYYVQGTIDGKETQWFSNGKISSIGIYDEGKPVGKWTGMDKEGMIVRTDLYTYDGKTFIDMVIDNQLRKSTSWFEEGGERMVRNYKNNKMHGKETQWFGNGQIASIGSYIDDKKVGKWIFWDVKGLKAAEKNFIEGNLFNEVKYEYYENDFLKSKNTFTKKQSNSKIEKQLNGESVYWYKNSEKFSEGGYKDNVPDGKWTWWHKNAKKDEERTYKEGVLIDKTIFKYSYFTGKLKSKKKYKDGKCISGC